MATGAREAACGGYGTRVCACFAMPRAGRGSRVMTSRLRSTRPPGRNPPTGSPADEGKACGTRRCRSGRRKDWHFNILRGLRTGASDGGGSPQGDTGRLKGEEGPQGGRGARGLAGLRGGSGMWRRAGTKQIERGGKKCTKTFFLFLFVLPAPLKRLL